MAQWVEDTPESAMPPLQCGETKQLSSHGRGCGKAEVPWAGAIDWSAKRTPDPFVVKSRTASILPRTFQLGADVLWVGFFKVMRRGRQCPQRALDIYVILFQDAEGRRQCESSAPTLHLQGLTARVPNDSRSQPCPVTLACSET